MADNKGQKLLAEFPPVTTEQWEEVIKEDLKGADYQKKLVWKTAEGFDVRPYYRAEDLANIGYMGSGIGEFPYVRGTRKCGGWKVHQTIEVTDANEANAAALKAIYAGTESLGFRMKLAKVFADDVSALLKGIDLEKTEITFTGRHVAEIARLIIGDTGTLGANPDEVRINFVIDPLIARLSLKGAFGCCPDGGKCFEELRELITKGSKYKRMRFVNVGGEAFHNSGSTIVQELAFTLAAGHEYLVKLMEAGLDIDSAASSIRFSMAVSANYFMEIAKFRAARMLWATIVKQYFPKRECSAKMLAHAVTSKWNLTVYDPYVNMLRGTTEAMSAAISGIHSLEVLPFDAAYEKPTEFSSRIARNVQLLLKHESHFDNVADPAGGSYYIENLTRSIAEQAWALFREVEEKGGYTASFNEGFIRSTIEASAAKKDMNIATRREILLGTNQYPNFTEVAGEEITERSVTRGVCTCGCEECGCCNGKERCCGEECDCGYNDGKENCECCGCSCGCDECTCCCCCCCDCNCECCSRKLKPYRGAMAFEEMRLKTDRSGKQPKAFMLTAGTLSMARARAQFSSNFFGCAGIRIIDNTFFDSVEEGAEKALASGAGIVVICAADDDYAELAPKAKEIIGDRAILVVAGAPASAAELEAKGITNFISVKSNVLQTLRYYLKELGI